MDRVFEIFEEILSIPRESGNESAIANEFIVVFELNKTVFSKFNVIGIL